MKKVILTIVTIATLFSCTTEEMAQSDSQDDTTPTEVSKFTGDYKLYMTVVSAPQSGELISATSHECPNTWTFQADFEHKVNVYAFDYVNKECVYRYQNSIAYSTPEENIIVVGGQTTYEVVKQGEDFVLVNTDTDSDLMVEYFLRKI